MKHLYRVTAYRLDAYYPEPDGGRYVLSVMVEDCDDPEAAARTKAREAWAGGGRWAITAVERVGDVVEVVE